MTTFSGNRFHWFLAVTFLGSCALAITAFFLSRSAFDRAMNEKILWLLPLVLLVWLILYLSFCWLLSGHATPPTLRAVIFGTLVVALPFLFFAPLSSTDLYANAYHGRLVSTHHMNPYGISDRVHLDDPYFDSTLARAPYQTTYGPLWITIAAAITARTGDQVGLTLFLFRGLNLLVLLAIIFLLSSIVQKTAAGQWLLAFFALNPLVLFEGIQNGHNDLLMVLFVVAALVAAKRGALFFLFPLLTLGGLIKYLPWLLFPLAVVVIWRYQRRFRMRLRTLVLSGGVSLVLLLAAFSPYWINGSTFRQLTLLGQFWGLPLFHPLNVVAWIFQGLGVTESMSRYSARIAGQVVFSILAVGIIVRHAIGRWSFASSALLTFLAFLSVGVIYFQPWYFLWLLPFVPLLPERWQMRALSGLTALPLATYGLYMPR